MSGAVGRSPSSFGDFTRLFLLTSALLSAVTLLSMSTFPFAEGTAGDPLLALRSRFGGQTSLRMRQEEEVAEVGACAADDGGPTKHLDICGCELLGNLRWIPTEGAKEAFPRSKGAGKTTHTLALTNHLSPLPLSFTLSRNIPALAVCSILFGLHLPLLRLELPGPGGAGRR